jgi:uncharacterized membrane protein
MLPDPLHPAVVHFPIVLAFLLPALGAVALWAIRSKRVTRQAWLGVVLLHVLLVGSAWAALATGELEEERVEAVVTKRHIENHEKSGERFLVFAALTLPITAAGLFPASLGGAARVLSLIATIALLGAGGRVGHSGGELVYRHGAAAAYGEVGSPAQTSAWFYAEHEDDD